MTRKVAVIGMGHVGATVAHYLVACGFTDDLALYDTNEAKVRADALDLRDAMANLPYHTRSSPKCWCKLNSANLSFHKLKHTGFF